MAGLTPYSYRPAATVLHRAGAGWKLLGLCALSFLAFFAGLPGIAAAAALTAAAAAAARHPPARLFAGARPLAVATLLVLVLRAVDIDTAARPCISFDAAGAREGLLFAAGVAAAYAAGSVLFATTTGAELRDALARAELTLKRILSPCLPPALGRLLRSSDLSLALALTLAFIPRVFAVWEAAEDAYAARCGRKGPAALAVLLPLAAERLIDAAAETAAAMTSRGYEGAPSAEATLD